MSCHQVQPFVKYVYKISRVKLAWVIWSEPDHLGTQGWVNLGLNTWL
jgi:hypothetical protein